MSRDSRFNLSSAEVDSAVRIGIWAYAAGVFLFILYPAVPPVIVLGAILGMLSALVAVGLVLIYRAQRIVNFAQGDLGGVAASVAATVIVGPKWGFWPAVIIGMIVAVALGALTEAVFIRRFAKAPRLVLTVATIGLAQLFQVLQLVIPNLVNNDATAQPPEPFDLRIEWFPATFLGGHILIALLAPAAVVGLTIFLRRSRTGTAIRAAAESADRAALLGIPVKRVNTVVWMISGAMAGLCTLLRLPIQGVSIGGVLDPSLMLRALAAAVIGRMESLPRTFAAAVGLGVVSEAVNNVTGDTNLVDAVLFGIIIVTLISQKGGGLDRARDLGASTWAAAKEVRPIPRELRSIPVVRFGLPALAAVAAVALLLVPLSLSPSQVSLYGVGLIFAIIMCSLVVLTGWAGQISLGQLAVVALGGAVTGTLAQQGKPFFLCLLLGGAAGAVIMTAIGVPALRIKGPFLAVTTLALAVATGTYFLNPKHFDWLVPDTDQQVLRPVLFDKFNLESEHSYYYVLLGAFLLVVASISRIRTSRTGRTLIANRENSRAAQSYGISARRAQLTAFALSGFYAGLAGGLYFFHAHDLVNGLKAPSNNLKVFSIGVLGGLSSLPGALIGAGYLALVDYSPLTATPEMGLLASGLGVLLVLLLLPGGLGGLVYDLRDGFLRRLAVRRKIVVPSLLADVRTDAEGKPIGGDFTIEPIPRLMANKVAGWGRKVATSADLAAAFVTRRNASTGAAVAPPPDHPNALLWSDGVEVAYGKTQVLFGVDLHVDRGEIVALLGTNGAGKSTFLSAVCGLVNPIGGRIYFDGHDITRWSPQETVNQGLVLMPGGKGVFPTLTVEENLALAGWRFADDPEYLKAATDQVLEYFPRLRERWDQRAGNMSGGEQQMLTLGQAFICKPDLLMIDELSLGLAPIVVEQLLGIVDEIHQRGTTLILVEQSVNVACTVAQRAIFMEKGEVRFDGPTAELLERPDVLRAVFLQGAGAKDDVPAAPEPALPSGLSLVHEHAPHDRPEEAHMPVVAKRHTDFLAECPTCGRDHPVALKVNGITARFGGITAVNAVDFEVREGQIIGLIGPNGAGKTTILDLISGFVQTSGGRIELNGVDVTELPPDGRAIAGLGRSFQDARLFPAMTVRQTIATALERSVPVRDPIAAALISPAVKMSEKFVEAEVERLIDLMRLGAFADKFVGELSTGSRRIVDLACTLAHRPNVLLLDEPSSGIAQRETEALGPVLLDIRDQLGAALIVIEHDMPLIQGISDELIALELGTVIARGEPSAVINDPRVIEGYLGGSEAVIFRSGDNAGGTTPTAAPAVAEKPAAAATRPRRRAPLQARAETADGATPGSPKPRERKPAANGRRAATASTSTDRAARTPARAAASGDRPAAKGNGRSNGNAAPAEAEPSATRRTAGDKRSRDGGGNGRAGATKRVPTSTGRAR